MCKYVNIIFISQKKRLSLQKENNSNFYVAVKIYFVYVLIIGRLSFNKTHVTANEYSTNIAVLFFVSDLKIIIIIIMSCRQHGYPWPSLATPPNSSSLLAGLQGYIPYPHIAAVCMFELPVLLLLGHMRGSIGAHHLWARPCFSSSVQHIWSV